MLPDSGFRRRETGSNAPESANALLMMSTSATVTVAGWPKPEKASDVGTSPRSTDRISAENAITS